MFSAEQRAAHSSHLPSNPTLTAAAVLVKIQTSPWKNAQRKPSLTRFPSSSWQGSFPVSFSTSTL